MAQFGLSVFLFPAPLKELQDTFEEVGCTVWYDAAHVLGLIAGGQFQDPLHEGANVLTAQTHKTFPGPNHGIVLGHNMTEELEKKLNSAVFPGVTSVAPPSCDGRPGRHLGRVGDIRQQYAAQICKNAKALGQAMHELGIDVLCAHKGFTESHTIAVNVAAHGGGDQASIDLEAANIITNKNMLPGDKAPSSPAAYAWARRS